jgi:hypothetical protein
MGRLTYRINSLGELLASFKPVNNYCEIEALVYDNGKQNNGSEAETNGTQQQKANKNRTEKGSRNNEHKNNNIATTAIACQPEFPSRSVHLP